MHRLVGAKVAKVQFDDNAVVLPERQESAGASRRKSRGEIMLAA
jgi:hypothetical protein